MSFIVPDSHSGFAPDISKRFRILLQKGAVAGITVSSLDCWWQQFNGPEEQYLAAHLLDALIYRSDEMLRSTCQHVLEFILPNTLAELKVITNTLDVDQFVAQLKLPNGRPELRFVAIDGTFTRNPGKSGGTVVRYLRGSPVHSDYFIWPEHIGKLPSSVKALILIDDCLGTGKQISDFCNHHLLSKVSQNFKIIFIPFVAHQKGIQALKSKAPYLRVDPVEVLLDGCGFFSTVSSDSNIWSRDGHNNSDEVKKIYRQVLKRFGVTGTNPHSLDLALGFHFSTPNNTLEAYYTNRGSWQPLLRR